MHSYLIGKSGSGKSTLLAQHILGNQGGFALLDPHGDLAEQIADTIPCLYWDTADDDFAVGFNPLAGVPQGHRHLAADNVVMSFKAIWRDSWGPRLEWILYNAVRLILDNDGSLLDIPGVLTDTRFRTRCLRRASLTDFWAREFDAWDNRFRNEAIAPVLNKIGQFVANPVLTGILAHRTIRPARLMDRGDRLVVNLSKGRLGEQASHLLGALLVSAFGQAAQGRASMPEEERRSFTLYIDEFQNFATESFASILSEARKYRLSIVLANQYLGQLSEPLRQAVFGNVTSFVSFGIDAEDAPLVAKRLGLHNPEILVDLPPFEYYARTGLDPQRLKTNLPLPPRGRLAANRLHTRSNFARPRVRLD